MSQIQLATDKESTESDSGRSLLRVRDLVVAFSKSHGIFKRAILKINAVSHLSFDVFPSEIFCIVGESGSGKTTVARCIEGLTKPTSGSIRFNETEVTKLKGNSLLDLRRQVQIIYQDPFESLSPRRDVFNTLAIPIKRLTGEKREERIQEIVANLLTEVQLDPQEVMYRYSHQLSGGQRQRVNIARALAPQPRLLIADEPITMLDAAQRLKVLKLLVDLKRRRNLTILMITHDLASAKLVGDRTMVMHLGRAVEIGRTRDVLSKPHHPYVELISESMPELVPPGNKKGVGHPMQLKNSVSAQESFEFFTETHGCNFRNRCKYATQICSEQGPELLEKSRNHFAACHNPLNS